MVGAAVGATAWAIVRGNASRARLKPGLRRVSDSEASTALP